MAKSIQIQQQQRASHVLAAQNCAPDV